MRWFHWVTWRSLQLALLLAATTAQGQDEIKPLADTAREWTVSTATGPRKLDAQLVGLRQGVAEFQQADGKKLSIPLDRLSKEDRRAALIEQVGSSVVEISPIDLFDEEAGFGSGFVMHADGLIITNFHVIAGAGSVKVTFRDQKEAVPAEVLSVDRLHDVAFLRVKEMPAGTHVLELQSTKLPVSGSSVWTLGHPSGLKNTVGWGDVNAVRKTAEMPEGFSDAFDAPAESRWLQTNAVLARGSSGGPLLNDLGQAIGVNTLVMGPQIGFAIHISHARDAYLEARKGTPVPLPVAPGPNQDAMAWPCREIAPLLKGYSEEYEQIAKGAAQLPQQEALSRVGKLQAKYRDQFFQLAQQTPSGWQGVQALAYTAQLCEGKGSEATLKQVCQLAIEHHGKDGHLSAVAKAVSKHPSDTARDFCRQVKQTTPHELLRIEASIGLVANMLRWLQAPESMDLPAIVQMREEVAGILNELEQESKQETSRFNSEEGAELIKLFRNQLESVRIGTQAPEITGVDIQGKTFKLSDYQGKVVLLDFYADWCPYCRQMYPSERAMVTRLKDRPFALLGVHCETQQVLDQLVKKKTVTWRSWADGANGPIAGAWEVGSFPTMVLIDAQGIIRWRSSGNPGEKELAKLVDTLVAEAEANAKPAGE